MAALHRSGRVAICYLDVGSWESYRPDAERFPRSAIGRRHEGFPDERWLDISHFHRFAPILEQCCQYEECESYEPFVHAGKAVFEAEYELEPSAYCDAAKTFDFSSIRKSYDLFPQPWETC